MTQYQSDVVFALSFPISVFYFAYNLVLATTYYEKLKDRGFSKGYRMRKVMPLVFFGLWLEVIYYIKSTF